MADIFISYAREDRNWVRGLAQDLEAEGYSVWWDPNLLPGSRYRETIEKELDQAFASIVVWSSDSIQSDFVRDEAEEARVLNRLVPVLKDTVQPPHGFRQIQTADLSDWRAGRRDHSEFVLVVEGLQALALAQAKGTPKPKVPPPPLRKTWAEKLTDTLKTPAGLGGLAVGVLIIVALAYFLGSNRPEPTSPAFPGPAPMQQTSNVPLPVPQPQPGLPSDPSQMTDVQKIQTCMDGTAPPTNIVAVCTDVLKMPTLQSGDAVRAHANRGHAYYTMHEYSAAVSEYTLALEIAPRYEYALVNRGSAYFSLNQFAEAMADYNAAAAINPQDPNAFGLRADLESRQNNLGAALADYQKAVSLAPANPNGWKGTCLMRAEMNIELDQALSDCNRAIQMNSNNALFYNALGLVQLRRNDNQGTIDAYSRALALQPNVATSLYGRGIAERRLGNMADALRDMASARAVQSNIDVVYSSLGITR